MALPEFNEAGDLPAGIHRASLEVVIHRFGTATFRRMVMAHRLQYIYEVALRTGHLHRFIVFGSFVTTKTEPNDVDVIILMSDTFSLEQCDPETCLVFDHARAHASIGASVFWSK